MSYKRGIFNGNIPYIKAGNGKNKLIFFQPTPDLLWSSYDNPAVAARTYGYYVPKNFTYYLFSYDKNLPADKTPENIADEYADVIKKEIGPASIASISYGGFVGIPFAAKYPELTKKLLLISTSHKISKFGHQIVHEWVRYAEKKNYHAMFERMVLFEKKKWQGITATLLLKMGERKLIERMNPISTFINAYKRADETMEQNIEFLKNIKAPTLIIGGSKDTLFTKEIYKEARETIPNSKLKIFSNVGHALYREKPNSLKKLAGKFLTA